MNKKIVHFVAGLGYGLGQAMVISPDREYVRSPVGNPFEVDNSHLSNDVKKVGKDLKNKLKQYSNGQPSYQR